MKVHKISYKRWATSCGLKFVEEIYCEFYWKKVTCKRCLKKKPTPKRAKGKGKRE